MLIVMAGLPASGKSAIAQILKQKLNAVLLDKDHIRACLFADYVEYSRPQDDFCVNVIYDVARYHLSERPHTSVILDGRTYSRRYQIDAVKDVAAKANLPLCIIECICSAETSRLRLESDKDNHIAKDRDYRLYQKSSAAAEPILEPRLTLNTDQWSKEQCAQEALNYILESQAC